MKLKESFARKYKLKEELISSERIYKVSEITQLIRLNLELTFPYIKIEGEISNLHVHYSSGHIYFSLKDEWSQIRAVMFKNRTNNINFELRNGLKVIAEGKITVYEPRGEYQIVVEKIEEYGIGELQKAFEKIKEKLRKEGLFDEKYKKPIPPFPKWVGIVTSPEGAAISDMVRIITSKSSRINILIYPVKVQGDGASQEISEGIRYLNKLSEIEVIITGRGGGSIEDLWAFNEESVARAIFSSRIPVISAVGHEIDFTIADFVADHRSPTPSAAAHFIVKPEETLRSRVKDLKIMVMNSIKFILSDLKSRVITLEKNRAFSEVQSKIRNLKQRIDDIEILSEKIILEKLKKLREKISVFVNFLSFESLTKILPSHKLNISVLEQKILGNFKYKFLIYNSKYESLKERLISLSPLNVLERGYSITMKDNLIIKEASQVGKGDSVNIILHKGELMCQVEDIVKNKD
ncbi:MAG: exodeoxyribonuclease VII large subunit [Acidobacteriota bacterium]